MHLAFWFVIFSAFSVGLVHTLLGPDHYVPFIAMAKVRRWSLTRTALITLLCGLGHVLSAVVLGLLALSIGLTLEKLKFIETWRGSFASWLLIGFGFAYFLWGLRLAYKNRKHTHLHFHSDGAPHCHGHNHHEEHAHVHAKKSLNTITPWILFVIFILGPCEPLIPLLMYPAVAGSPFYVFLVSLCFGAATLLVMLSMVLMTVFGISHLRFAWLERYGNATAGAIICSCGLAIKFLGL
jgi:nickel/cobalt transporter (NicO) family protein